MQQNKILKNVTIKQLELVLKSKNLLCFGIKNVEILIKLKVPMIFVKLGFCIARKCPLQILQTCSQV